MSCDLHVHIEVKIRYWSHALPLAWEHLSMSRVYASTGGVYALFSRMAGVRAEDGDPPPIAQPRGLPRNATRLTRFDAAQWGPNGHTHSWLSIREMAELGRWWEKAYPRDYRYNPHGFEGLFGYIFNVGWDQWIRFPEDRPARVHDARCVFWFAG